MFKLIALLQYIGITIIFATIFIVGTYAYKVSGIPQRLDAKEQTAIQKGHIVTAVHMPSKTKFKHEYKYLLNGQTYTYKRTIFTNVPPTMLLYYQDAPDAAFMSRHNIHSILPALLLIAGDVFLTSMIGNMLGIF